MIKEKMLFEKE